MDVSNRVLSSATGQLHSTCTAPHLGAVTAVDEALEDAHEGVDVLAKLRHVRRVRRAQLQRERHRAQQHAVVAVADE
jgi:hypothetical protein